MQKRLHLILALLLFLVTSAIAQVTTSAINGKVTAGTDNVIGATVTAVHEPSGTRYNAVTNIDGRYTIQGMRVGGPYTVTIDYIGYKSEKFSGVNLALGDTRTFNVDLKEDARQLGEVVVTGQAGRSGFGASTNFAQQQIENTPTVDRNIYDVAKLSPLVNSNKFGGISIAGTNNRYNSFQIDGMVANDVFGLTSTGTNGGQTGANPISMDAIEQIQVVASPFDVRQSGFTGGAINAITKSGTNKLTGTAFSYYTNENLYGRWSQYYNKRQKLTDETTETYGFTLGGPIIKDKLFFFTSLEYKKHSYPTTFYAGAPGYFMTKELAQQIAQRYYDVTGIQESYDQRDINREGMSLLGRIDWNINTRNHFSLRYQGNISYDDNLAIGSTTFSFNNSGYKMKDRTHSFVAELTSHLNDKLYNELRAGVTFVRDHRETPYSGPTVFINAKDYKINLGTEYSSGVNSLDQNIWTLEDNLSIYSGSHTFTLGTHNEYYQMHNGFVQAAFGEFVYNKEGDFLTDETPASYQMKYSDASIAGTTAWRTPFKAGQFGIYAQDKWDLSTMFQLTYGLRIDAPFYFNHITANEKFNQTNWAANSGVRVGRRPATMVMASPRIGFRLYLDQQHQSLLRGGMGIFNGRAPFVWLENAWANTGMEMSGLNIRNNAPKFGQYGGKSSDEMRAAYSAKGGVNPDIVTVDHKFRFPQAFRTNLALEQQLPFGIKMTLEALYSKMLNAVWFENIVLNPQGTVYAVPGVEHSGTVYYSSSQTSPYINGAAGTYRANSVINMTNTNKGYSYSFSAKLEKSFNFGLDLMASYTFGHSKSVNDGTSSVASSNWGYYYCVDPNQQTLAYSMFDMPHKVMVQANYNTKRYGAGRWQTHVALTYNGFSGQRYSLTMNDGTSASFNGDFRRGNTLLYIPTTTELAQMKFVDAKDRNGKVIMTAEESRKSFANWIENDKYAKDHRGQYADRNSNMAPWENHFDFHLAQDFFYLKERGSKVSLVFDILNVGNLINKHWGDFYSNGYNQNILNVASVTYDKNTKVATPSYTYVGNAPVISDFSSRWHMQLGLRVTF